MRRNPSYYVNEIAYNVGGFMDGWYFLARDIRNDYKTVSSKVKRIYNKGLKGFFRNLISDTISVVSYVVKSVSGFYKRADSLTNSFFGEKKNYEGNFSYDKGSGLEDILYRNR